MRSGHRAESGQSTVEYVGLVLLVALLALAALAVSGLEGPARRLAAAISERSLCAVRLGAGCSAAELDRALGEELASRLREHAPEVRFEDAESVSLPVDPRACRERRCSDTSERGRIQLSWEGEAPTAFVRAIDCRPDAAQPIEGIDCSGERADNLYLQYWLYYPDSATRPFGARGYHPDDWESLQVRVLPDGVAEARASSHRGYQYGPDWQSDAGIDLGGDAPRWGPALGYVWVSAGSHAGRAAEGEERFRSIRPGDLRLIPIETNLAELDALEFGVTPPWRKRVFSDPEHDDS